LQFKKTIGLIHLWLGLASGLVVFILGITGCIYSFADELKSIVYKDRLYVEKAGKVKLPVSRLLPIAQTVLGEAYPISRVQLFNAADRTYQFRAIKLDREAFGYANYYQYYYLVYLDPYTGKVRYKENAKWEFFTIALAMHMNLLLGYPIGHFVVKWSTVCFVVLLLSGLVLWWPKSGKRRQVRQALTVKWTGKFKRLNYDLHNVPGFYSFLLLFVIAYTGLMMSFGLISPAQTPISSAVTGLRPAVPVDSILKHAMSGQPSAAYYFYNLPVTPEGTANVSAYFSKVNFYDRVMSRYDRYSGALLYKDKHFSSLKPVDQVKTINYDLHMGSVLGLPGKILGFLASLIAATLPLTGLVIWLGKGRKKI
jgi:uncharacterized iron-regulated membrane protein